MEISSTQQLGKEVRRRRIADGLSQDELALVSDVSRSFVRRLEGGKPGCTLELALKVINTLGMRLELEGLAPAGIATTRQRKGRTRGEADG